jgi:hypothetical protein
MDTERLVNRLWQPLSLRVVLLLILAIMCLGTNAFFLWARFRPEVRECSFNERVTVGDLQVEIRWANTCPVLIRNYTETERRRMLYVVVSVTNINPGNTVEWDGWQGQGIVEDEHGRRLRPADLEGWLRVPEGARDDLGLMPISVPAKIPPGATYDSAVFFELDPHWSEHVTVSFQLDGVTLRFRGTLEHGNPLNPLGCVTPPPPPPLP